MGMMLSICMRWCVKVFGMIIVSQLSKMQISAIKIVL